MRPKPPAKDAPRDEWLRYWHKTRGWAVKRRDRLQEYIKKDALLVEEARDRVSKLSEKLRREQINWNGKTPVWAYAKEIRAASLYGLYITATKGRPGVHSPTSYHYRPPNYAVDMASGSVQAMISAQEALLKQFGAGHFRELFGPAPWYVKNGQKIPGYFPDHGDHIHFAK